MHTKKTDSNVSNLATITVTVDYDLRSNLSRLIAEHSHNIPHYLECQHLEVTDAGVRLQGNCGKMVF